MEQPARPGTFARFRAHWRRLSASAARVQSNVILTLVYFLMVVPVALVRRPFSDPLGRRTEPGWRDLPQRDGDLDSVRRQF
jgi:hypothetical protein